MSLYSSFPQSDIPFVHRLIELTCNALEKPKLEACDDVPIHQCFQLLQNYRYGAFDWRNAHRREGTIERINRLRCQEAVKTAFIKAGEALNPGRTNEEIAVPITNALRMHYKGNHADLADARKFFAHVKSELAAHLS